MRWFDVAGEHAVVAHVSQVPESQSTMNVNLLRDAQAEALFVSDLQPSQRPTDQAVRAAIARSIRAYGPCGCAVRVAGEFGEHPETAVTRMIWARKTVQRYNAPVLAAAA
jgi:hypothetical protein